MDYLSVTLEKSSLIVISLSSQVLVLSVSNAAISVFVNSKSLEAVFSVN